MAKVSANGNTAIAKCKARFGGNDAGAEHVGGTSTFVLRSDGAILKKGPGASTYKVWRKFKTKPMPNEAAAKLQAVVRAAGYEVTEAGR